MLKPKTHVKKYDYIICFFLAFFSTFSLSLGYFYPSYSFAPNNSFIYFFIFVIVFILSIHSLKTIKTRRILCSFVVSFIFACIIRIGAEFSSLHHLDLKNVFLYLEIIGLSIILTLLFDLFFKNWNLIITYITNLSIPNIFLRLTNSRYYSIVIFFLILLFWLPAFLAVYPGLYSYDAYPQIMQTFINHQLDAHHPVIHTLLLTGCFILGHALTNDYNTGLTIYCIIQALFMSAAFSYFFHFVRKHNLPKIIDILSFIFLAFNPIIQIWVFTTTKDVIFAGFLLLLLLDIIDILLNPSYFCRSRMHQFRYVIYILMVCLFRNQGFYVVCLFLPFLLIALKKYWKRLLLISLLALILVKTITGPLSTALNIKPTNPREALCLPIQQLARVLNVNNSDVTEEEVQTIYNYIPAENIVQYLPDNVDYVKEGFNSNLFKKDSLTFFKTWLSVGLKNPSIYLDAFLYNSYGYWYTDTTPYSGAFIFYDGAHLENGKNILNIKRDPIFTQYDTYLRKISYEIIQDRIPIISTVLNQAFPFWVIIFIFACLFYSKKYTLIIPLILVLGYWGTLLLGPLISVRYAFPLIILIPILFSMPFLPNCSQINKAIEKSSQNRCN